MGYSPQEKASIQQAMTRGFRLPAGVSIESVLVFSNLINSLLSETELAQFKIRIIFIIFFYYN